ncbi:MAG: polynucleotide adenylyltransferase PcnB [Treponema sp.]|nr:polynucleotide adenylyltransferase PcnB [Treponema sp.]
MLIRYGTNKFGKPVQKAVIYTKEEHKISKDKIDRDAVYIINRLHDSGFTSYIVGGAVRDLIIGNVPKDFDIVTDATPSRIKRLFRNSRIIGRRFRLVHVVFGDKIFEVSTFRSNEEGSVGNEFGSMDEDVLRRDFSINALYYDPLTEQVIDYVNGVNDIKKHVLRPVIPLDRIFVEDPVRMIRAIKYSVTTDAKMSFSLRSKIRHSSKLLSQISPSRLTEELLKIINGGHSAKIIHEALELEVFMYLQPCASDLIYSNKNFEVSYMKSLEQLDYLVNNEKDVRQGKKLFFLIRDFAENLTDWKKEIKNKTSPVELYARTWRECRNFVLPMNPIRKELEYAVKEVLQDLGVRVASPKKKGKKTDTQED